MAKKSLKDVKEELLKISRVTPWDEIKKGDLLHIPPIVSLERRDILVMEKDKDELVYRRVDKDDKESLKMHRTSIFSRFVVKRRKF